MSDNDSSMIQASEERQTVACSSKRLTRDEALSNVEFVFNLFGDCDTDAVGWLEWVMTRKADRLVAASDLTTGNLVAALRERLLVVCWPYA